jgi:hypothetical protein
MPDVDPEQLLKELDAELASMRANRRRPASGGQRNVRLLLLAVFGVMVVLILWVLQVFLSQMTPTRSKPAPPAISGEHP